MRTFVAALRRVIEPGRPARPPATLLVTQGIGYAMRCAPDQVDAWRFEHAVARAGTADPAVALARLDEALAWWRGPAYADFPDAAWAPDRSRLAELRLHAVERLAEERDSHWEGQPKPFPDAGTLPIVRASRAGGRSGPPRPVKRR